MNRTIKDATVKRFYYETHDQLRRHLADFVAAYNFARRLKTLEGLTPYESICKLWTAESVTVHPQSAPPNAGTEHLAAAHACVPARAEHHCPSTRSSRKLLAP